MSKINNSSQNYSYIIYAVVALVAFVLTFAMQNVLFLMTNHIIYIYELLFSISWYAVLCLLYFSLRFFETKTQRNFRFLFAKTFWPALIFTALVLANASFNFISIFSSVFCVLLVVASLGIIITSFVFTGKTEKSDISQASLLPDIFSEREKEVAELILQGKTAQQTADALFVSLSTVKTHILHIYEKAGVHNRAELARWVNGK